MTQQDAGGVLTAGQVGKHLGLKSGMVRRYALALEAVTGISLEVDPVRGRLYPPEVVSLLEQTRAHLLAHSGLSVEDAMRAVTGQSEGAVTAPVRVPGSLTPADLEEALRGVLLPVLAELQESRRESEALRAEVAELRHEVRSLPSALTPGIEGAVKAGQAEALAGLGEVQQQLARVEVTAHAALARPADQPAAPDRQPWLVRLLRGLTGR